ncbi:MULTISPECIES: sigma-70 family RNA polymerase sigma factor [unclassified Synechococcus]|uniref:sigma-70 family RNA polymerase sigma factor n=1 Tax=unclassified Synechococcus TaxID=2626047 RepID=UPI0021A77772|nr:MULTISPECIES: sigma-70 family RNA polymerase sigma factor [unclassified Synechococcus]MCT0214414.1 sigma-70 family RNA polymerase sigma factor [Synechococcus sp. CS-1326]MCT0233283.1 sigma-70 family RNA polymerase sigma factor [Synechococcus sp. CS-1327]
MPIRSTAAPVQRASLSRDQVNRRNQRVASYHELVRPIALHYSALSPECPDDLIQVGLLGLIRAAELFVPSLGTPFSAFARHHIRGAILHYLRDQAAPIRVPRRQQELEDKLRQVIRSRQSLGQPPASPEEIRDALGLGIEQWERFQRLRGLARPLSLELQSQEPAAPELVPSAAEEAGAAMAVLAQLAPGPQAVVRQVVLEGHSLRRVAKALNVSPMTVHRQLNRALTQLRDQLDCGERVVSSGLKSRRGSSAVPAC